jgi:chromosome segregation ATPase
MGLKEIKEQRRAEAEARKTANKAIRDAQTRLKASEEEIASLESRQRELVSELETSGGRAFELNRELATLQERLSIVMEEWERISASLPVVESEQLD